MTTPNSLEETARALVTGGKGILAADERVATLSKRFDTIGIVSTPENRRAYREMLFTTPELSQYISGAILYDETIHQRDGRGVPFTEVGR